ncbi:venom carboxylesterase-6 isoform X1 [Eurytemora carolleeae]|uniref:venom carboxylesterase-6 isoform X1 n=1 Tax=Eurytemora carolleeae TaxID=1294199 RepID=UPI000C766279|nr:venom carboxylesterase-6 isoform X1 [Eurytemora carolleeae]|eukprot:XP_023342225.1 venom carboxylesterase-6-like isoform X1 [Eurytemora affinis]
MSRWRDIIIVLLLSCQTAISLEKKTVLIETLNGPVLGSVESALDPRFNQSIEYKAFYGIPFAQPPLGDLRFRPPQPVSNWTEPINATEQNYRICYQVGGIMSAVGAHEEETDDCLQLTVYVPLISNSSSSSSMPVLLWISGGGFLIGGSHWYGPDFLMIHEVILVVINYRVGPLGFLTLGTQDAPGNMGLLDQIAALQWVQDNIALFGGDPDRVTVAGESAGSFSTFYHLASPKSKGLFKRIIGQSGLGGLAPGFHQFTPQEAIRYGHEAAIEVGCLQLFPEAILDCLKHESDFWLSLVDFAIGVLSQPVVDGQITDDPYLPEYPEIVFQSGNYDRSVDILLGANYNEGLLITQAFIALPFLLPVAMDQWDTLGPLSLFMKKALQVTDEDSLLAREILQHYTGRTPEEVTMDDLPKLTDMFTDAFFWFGNHRFIEMHRGHAEGTFYQYINKHINDDFQFTWTGLKSLPGVCHVDELPLIFSPFISFDNKEKGARDLQVSKFITTAWTNFMKTGDPGLGWQSISSTDWMYMSIGEEPVMEVEEDYIQRMDYWKNILPRIPEY